jgi:hypothetical protein
MTALNAVSRTLYGKKRWKKNTSLIFAQQDNVIPIGVSEFSKTIMSTAVGFLTIDNKLAPVALQSLIAGQNWFVGPDGKWQGDYLPALYRCYPFRFIKAENDELVLCIDEASGLVTDDISGNGELFFDTENNPSAIITQIINELNKIEQDTAKARAICSLLQKYELFEPWPIQIQGEGGAQELEGLYRINEGKLNSLPAEALLELRNNNALLVVYGQLFSMHNLQKLGKLASAYTENRNKAQALNMGLGVVGDSGNISFDNL